VFLYYFRERRDEFNPVLHAIFPLIGTVALFFVAYRSLSPWPAPPVGYAPGVVGAWFALGLLALLVLNLMGKHDWLVAAGRVAEERVETAEEADHRALF
jgi:hypothetical protein